jgi:hypothetical protein
VIFLTGCGIFRWVDRGVTAASQGTGLGLFGFFSAVAVAFYVGWRIRRHLHDWAEKKYPDKKTQRWAGAGAGAARAFFIAAYVVLFFSLQPIGFLKKPFTEGSFFGHAMNKLLLPVYELTREN